MKWVKIIMNSQYEEAIIRLLHNQGIHEFTDCRKMFSEDREGPRRGDQIWPGTSCIISIPMPDEEVEGLLRAIAQFKEENPRHAHVRVLVIPVETVL
jgi:hypothetical protein